MEAPLTPISPPPGRKIGGINPDFFRQEEVRLIARESKSSIGQEGVRFFVTPELNESRNVNYTEISDIRQPGGLLIYIGTPLRTYQINARFISRTQEEADLAFTYTHLLKAWTMPSKGGDGRTGGENAPEILKLYAYGYDRQIRGVPVVITSLGIDYPANVTYISTSNGKAFVPIMQTFSISLKEARSTTELQEFKLSSYKNGTFEGW